MPRLVIADQNLTSYGGHCWEYSSTIARLFKDRGQAVTILSNKKAEGVFEGEGLEVIPCFTYASADIYRPHLYRSARLVLGGLPGFLVAPLRIAKRFYARLKGGAAEERTESLIPSFGQECVEVIEKLRLGEGDDFFIPTLHAEELFSLAQAMEKRGERRLPRLLGFLRHEPSAAAMRDLKRALEAMPPFMERRIFFFSDTPALSEGHAQVFGLKVKTLPIIGDLSLIRERAKPGTEPRARKILYLGNARREKGFHLLPGMISELSRSYPHFAELEFHIQCNMPEEEEADRALQAALRQLKRTKGVSLYPYELSQEAYANLLGKVDLLLLPYDAAKYTMRSSGILVQALVAGKPVVAPAHTWFGDSAPQNTVQLFEEGGFPAAVLKALENYPALKAGAEQQAMATDIKAMSDEFYQALKAS